MTATLKTVLCSCDCKLVFLEIDAVYDDLERPFYSIDHLGEDGLNAYLDRYNFYEELMNEM